MGKNIRTRHFVAQTSWGNHCNHTLLWLLIRLPQSIARSLVHRPWFSFVQFDRNRVIIVCRCPRWVLILNVPFQIWFVCLRDGVTKNWQTRGRLHRVLHSPILCYTHTGAVLQSDSSLHRLIRTHSEQPQNNLMLQFKMYVVGYYTVKGARITIPSLYNTFNELMHPIQ